MEIFNEKEYEKDSMSHTTLCYFLSNAIIEDSKMENILKRKYKNMRTEAAFLGSVV